MPSPQPLRIPYKEMIFLFVSPKFQQLGSKFAINSKANAPLKTDEGYVNANNINCNANAGIMCKHGQLKETLHILEILNQCHLDSSTYACLLQGCLNNKSLPGSKRIHAHIIQTGFHCQDVFLWTLLVTIYAKLGFLLDGRKVFDKMLQRNVVSWTVMIAAYARHGFGREAMALFRHMQDTDVQPNQFTFASVIPACASLIDLEDVYDEIRSLGYDSDVFVANGLVDMYAKCGNIEKARDLFDKMPMRSVVSWNAMIAAYAQKGYFKEALKLFKEMPERNVASWNAMIAGYAQNGLVEEAMNLFREMPMPNVVSWTSMITGYAQDGKMDEALKLFQEMPERNVVSWNAMIAGYAQNGLGQEALKFFCQMKSSGFKPNSQTFVGVLPVCANLAALEQGMEIHDDVMRSGYQSDIFVGNALVDMYAKCGSIENARHVFDKMHQRDVVSWTTMIAGYAMHGYGKQSVQLFEQMRLSAVKPDRVTFIGVLSACCHAGLVDEGRQYFDCMSQHYHILPTLEHYGCMIDLLSRAGQLDEALDFIKKMPIKPDAAVWGSLLGACRIHKNIELAEYVAKHIFELDPKNGSPYVLLSNIYAAAGRWDNFQKLRGQMRDRKVKMKSGCSWIEVNKHVHMFLAGD
jgi:pentatricopeptide repeat protein